MSNFFKKKKKKKRETRHNKQVVSCSCQQEKVSGPFGFSIGLRLSTIWSLRPFVFSLSL